MSLIPALLLLALTIPLVVTLMRANELFLLRIEHGRAHVARGRIPQKLLNDIADIVNTGAGFEGTLRGVVEDRRVRLYPDGTELGEDQKQRLRNTVSLWTVAQIRNAPRSR